MSARGEEQSVSSACCLDCVWMQPHGARPLAYLVISPLLVLRSGGQYINLANGEGGVGRGSGANLHNGDCRLAARHGPRDTRRETKRRCTGGVAGPVLVAGLVAGGFAQTMETRGCGCGCGCVERHRRDKNSRIQRNGGRWAWAWAWAGSAGSAGCYWKLGRRLPEGMRSHPIPHEMDANAYQRLPATQHIGRLAPRDRLAPLARRWTTWRARCWSPVA